MRPLQFPQVLLTVSLGAALGSVSGVGLLQCGQAIVLPKAPFGKEILPLQWTQAPLMYSASLIQNIFVVNFIARGSAAIAERRTPTHLGHRCTLCEPAFSQERLRAANIFLTDGALFLTKAPGESQGRHG